jgi:hypothetical protein
VFLQRLAIAACVLSAAAIAYSQNRVARAVRASARIVVDGVLEDAVWAVAPAATEFIQRDPDEGRPATERTDLRIAYYACSIASRRGSFNGSPAATTSPTRTH